MSKRIINEGHKNKNGIGKAPITPRPYIKPTPRIRKYFDDEIKNEMLETFIFQNKRIEALVGVPKTTSEHLLSDIYFENKDIIEKSDRPNMGRNKKIINIYSIEFGGIKKKGK